MQAQSILLERGDHIARITLNLPARHNAMGAAEIERLTAVLDEVEQDGETRAVVLTGAGERTFCSGAALGQLQSGAMSGETWSTLTDRLAALALPTVCVLNGNVYGGGAEIALACDYRIGVDSLRLLVPAARIGLCYPLAGLQRYVDKLGLSAAKRILVVAEELDAAELRLIGFLHRAVPRERLEAESAALATHLAGLAPLAVRGMKRLLGAIARGELDREDALATIRRCAESGDLQEGLAAQRERRAPVFRGL
jgi:enoyl-CoA hydratase/carnithine racemase